jgi:hypothetical protein
MPFFLLQWPTFKYDQVADSSIDLHQNGAFEGKKPWSRGFLFNQPFMELKL